MRPTTALVAFLVPFALALALTPLARRYALARSILDVPNPRSLHSAPVPRGGGLAIVATFALGIVILGSIGLVPVRLAIALVGGGLIVALIGWLDDRSGLRPLVRIAAHSISAVWALGWLGGVDQLQFGGHTLQPGAVMNVLAAVGIVWWTNLYNFMDGIDGIAAGQAVTVGAGAALLTLVSGASSVGFLPLVLAGAAGGFLPFNWAPARIFMGDSGSGYLGFAFAVLALGSERSGGLPALYWVMLSGVFIFDSTITLIRRAAQGQVWYAAHRSHAYQRLVAVGHSHARVAGGVMAVNVCIIATLALAVAGVVNIGVVAAIEILALTIGYLLVEAASPMTRNPANGSRVPTGNA